MDGLMQYILALKATDVLGVYLYLATLKVDGTKMQVLLFEAIYEYLVDKFGDVTPLEKVTVCIVMNNYYYNPTEENSDILDTYISEAVRDVTCRVEP